MADHEPQQAPEPTHAPARSVGRFEGWYGIGYNRLMRRSWLRRPVYAAIGGAPALRDLPRLVDRIAQAHPAGEPLLDAPCGEGLVERLLQRRGWTDPVTALDLAARAVERTSALDVAFPLRVVRDSALDMPFADASFATLVSINGLHVMPDQQRFLRELGRVLTPGGSIWLTTILSGPGMRRRALVRSVRALGVLPVEPPTWNELERMVGAAGLRIAEDIGAGTTIVALRLTHCVTANRATAYG